MKLMYEYELLYYKGGIDNRQFMILNNLDFVRRSSVDERRIPNCAALQDTKTEKFYSLSRSLVTSMQRCSEPPAVLLDFQPNCLLFH